MKFTKNLHVIDNQSSDEETLKYLRNECEFEVHYMDKNYGHKVFINNKSLYDSLPQFFAISDPDLELNENLPINFLQVLKDATIKYNVFKAGFALDISDFDKMFQCKYCKGKTIKEFHSQFWRIRVKNNQYEIYNAPIDTTFAVYNKSNSHKDFMSAVRFAGDFTAKHIPWYVDNWIYKKEELMSSVYQDHIVPSAMKTIYKSS